MSWQWAVLLVLLPTLCFLELQVLSTQAQAAEPHASLPGLPDLLPRLTVACLQLLKRVLKGSPGRR